MSDQIKRFVIADSPKTPQKNPNSPGSKPVLRPSMRRRPRPELIAIAERIEQNAALMARFRSAKGSGNDELGREVMAEVKQYAQTLDPSVNVTEGTAIIVILLERSDGRE